MLRMRNKYCSNCLKTQRFLDLSTYLVCEKCSKRLDRIEPVAAHPPPVVKIEERRHETREAM